MPIPKAEGKFKESPNKPLQLTAGSGGFITVFRVVAGFGLSDGFR
jgi:hypothetical protein